MKSTVPVQKERWTVGLDDGQISVVMEIAPQKIEFDIKAPITKCTIKKGKVIVTGFAICSANDKFDRDEGKKKALSRAIKALVDGHECERIRSNWTQFPGGWTKRQIDRVLKFRGYRFKSKIRQVA